MYLGNISDFGNTSDYLYILNGALVTDIIFMFIFLKKIFVSKELEKWYRTYHSNGVIADVFIISIGIILARFFYSYVFTEYSLIQFIGLAIIVQITHDILFYLFFSAVPRGNSKILDTFKDYAKETGIMAIIADSIMITCAILIASFLKKQSLNVSIITTIVSVYLVPFLVYSF
jgi:uncharacterized protein YacL